MSNVGERIEEAIEALRRAIAEESTRSSDGGPSAALKSEVVRVFREAEYGFNFRIEAPDEHLSLYTFPDEMLEIQCEVNRTIDLELLLADELESDFADEQHLRYLLGRLSRMVAAVQDKLGVKPG